MISVTRDTADPIFVRILADRELAKNSGQVDELRGARREETLDARAYDFGDKAIDWG